MSVNDDPIYGAYWPYVSELWEHFGLHPYLIHLTDDMRTPFAFPSKFGTVIQSPLIPDVESAYQASIARFFAAATIPGGNYLMDIDMLPCNDGPIRLREKVVGDAEYGTIYVQVDLDYQPPMPIMRLAKLPITLGDSPLHGWGGTANMEVFRAIFEANDIYTFPHDFWNRRIFDRLKELSGYEDQWTADETHLGTCVFRYMKENPTFIIRCVTHGVHHIGNDSTFNTTIRDMNRIIPPEATFETLRLRREKILNGEYWEAHIRNDRSKLVTKFFYDTVLGKST